MLKLLLFALSSTSFYKIASSCNNYELIINKIDDCNKDNVIKIGNFGVTLDKDCNIVSTGCIDIKGFKTAQVHYLVTKTSMAPMEGDIDLCALLKSNKQPAIGNTLSALGLPQQCPMSKTKICSNAIKKINVSKYKPLLPVLQGIITVKSNVVHDTGTTCADIKATLQKKKRSG